MITNIHIKFIKSLAHKKNRLKHQLFIVEGKKNVEELLDSDFEIHSLFATDDWVKLHPRLNIIKVSNDQLSKISIQKNPNQVLAIVKIKHKSLDNNNNIILVLDGINDPGNLGTIIRVCDWFGVKDIVCSNNSVDCYNSKVVQSSMGSIFRVSVFYTNLSKYLSGVSSSIFGGFVEGNNVKKISFPKKLHLIMGNESNGISNDIARLITNKVKIRSIGKKTESLNVAISTSIILHEICS